VNDDHGVIAIKKKKKSDQHEKKMEKQDIKKQ
jgi:hypothetical protein